MAKTIVEVRYPLPLGKIGLRGDRPPLSWRTSLAPVEVSPCLHRFTFDLEDGTVLEFKPVRDERGWSVERNYTVLAGETAVVSPYFDRSDVSIEPTRAIASPELQRSIKIQVVLPPSYKEHYEKRYPVLYAQDGQALFSTSVDLFDGVSWRMDKALEDLYELGAIEEIIVVGIHTAEERIGMLSPTPDPDHGGGDGPKYVDFMAETLKPFIDQTYRTLPGRTNTALIGSSMGGLFSFFAAWTRPDVFGKTACLSGSFWWDRRFMVREVQKGYCPAPRPYLYIDSGAARTTFEEDANVRDGFHDTMAMREALVSHCYTPGVNIQTFAFAGLTHNNASWAARLAVPLQILFPRRS